MTRAPSPSDLLARSRDIVGRMHDVERWAYAIPIEGPRSTATPTATSTSTSTSTSALGVLGQALLENGYRVAEEDASARVTRYESDGSAPDTVVALERPDLHVIIVQAFGATTVDRLGPVLERTGFVPQSRLLGEAYDVGSPDASRALTTLAHMVVVWDEDWTDLFLLHLASPDPMARHTAALATVVAAFSARAREPALSLLRETLGRESFPKLRETLQEAIASLEVL